MARLNLTPEHDAKVRAALQKIEEAQNLLYHACADLSSVPGGIGIWEKVSKQGDKVKALWYTIESRRTGGPVYP